MRAPIGPWRALVLLGTGAIAACSPASDAGRSPARQDAPKAAVNWPASLKVVGDGYPTSGASCRRIGESPATSNFLDDSAALVGCPDAASAEKLGGRTVAVVDDITLVSVPLGAPAAGAGPVSGDALVPGTRYNATAEVLCAGYRRHPAGRCPAGVKRNTEGGLTLLEIEWPGGDDRTLFFDAAGKLVGANTNQADGSAAFAPEALRKGDTIVVTIGPERYEFAKVLLTGD